LKIISDSLKTSNNASWGIRDFNIFFTYYLEPTFCPINHYYDGVFDCLKCS